MKRFTRLYTTLDQTTKTNLKVAALAQYFAQAQPEDAAWAIYFLSGGKLPRLIPRKWLRQWSAEAAGVEPWLFEECYEIVGDLAEVMALILPPPTAASDLPLHHWVTERLQPLRRMTESAQRQALLDYWAELDTQERFVLHKLITGSFRIGVSRRLVVRGLAQYSGVDPEVLTHRLMGDWQPTGEAFQRLTDPDTRDAAVSQPYPFCLAYPIAGAIEDLGDPAAWQAEWKWDGIRAQLLKRDGQVFIWSRGEDLLTDRFPELCQPARRLPDGTALDGEIVGWKNGTLLPFSELQRRIGRKQLSRKILTEVPVSYIAFDLLEFRGVDFRGQALHQRRQSLEHCMARWAGPAADPGFQLAPTLPFAGWGPLAELRQTSRAHQTEGLMLKRLESTYGVGRVRGTWWKWKIEPYTIDAVLIYAQRGHGRRASLYTDYTFGVWKDGQLVPFAKAYSGLTDEEIRRVDRFVRAHTLERFGPVRSVTPQLVFELAFENIQPSTRHKSGIAVRFPRIVRWREDLRCEDADTLDTIKSMMDHQA